MTDSSSHRRKRAARLIDIAEQAGVGIATVNRVLNERDGVSPALREKVIEAAKALGVKRTLPDVHHGVIRFDVVLAYSTTPFFARLEQALQRHAQALGSRFVIHRHNVAPSTAPQVIRDIGASGQRCDGLIVALQDAPAIQEALQRHIEQGRPVVTLMSGISALLGARHAGIDNTQAGRTAAYFMLRQSRQPGRVLVIANHPDYRAHAERVQGFLARLAEAPHGDLQSLPPLYSEDDPDRAQMALRDTLATLQCTGDHLSGLYTTGAGTKGIHAWLQRLPQAARPVWIGHEASDEHRASMREGLLDLVIDQDPDGQVAAAMHHLLHATGHVAQAPSLAPHPFQLFCAENTTGAAYLPPLD